MSNEKVHGIGMKCPITQKECYGEDCGWWVTPLTEYDSEGCAIYIIGRSHNG